MHNNTEKCVFDEGEIYVLPEIDITTIKRKKLDIPYAEESFFQKFDIYYPDQGEGPFPIVVFIHGGGWRRGDKRDTQAQGIMKLRERGFAVASINWRLSGEAIFPAGIIDCKAAIRYIKGHANDLHIDPKRIAVSGVSAGGHMALLVATTVGKKEFEDLTMGNPDQDTVVQCAVVMYTVAELETIEQQAKENESKGIINISDNSWKSDDPKAPHALMLGGALDTLDPQIIYDASPMHYINPDMSPVLLQHGKADFIAPCQQSIEFYEKAKQIIGEKNAELDLFENALHMDPVFDTDQNADRIAAFLNKHMGECIR